MLVRVLQAAALVNVLVLSVFFNYLLACFYSNGCILVCMMFHLSYHAFDVMVFTHDNNN